MTVVDSSFGQRLLRWCAALLLLIFMVVLLVFTLLPLAARWGVEYWLAQQGVNAQLQHVEIAPVAGRLQLSGLKGESKGRRVLQLDNLIVDFNWLPLRDNRLELTEVSVSGLYAEAHKIDGQQWLAGLNLASLQAEADSTNVANESASSKDVQLESETAAKAAPPWQISLQQLNLDNIGACAAVTEGQQQTTHVCVDLGQIGTQETLSLVLGQPLEVNVPAMHLQDLLLRDQVGELDLLSLASFELQRLKLAQQRLSLNAITLGNLNILQRPAEERKTSDQPYHIALSGLNLNELSHSLDQGVTGLERLVLSGMDILVHRDQDGLPVQRRVENLQKMVGALVTDESAGETAVVSKNPESASQATGAFSLKQFAISQDSRVLWLDEAVQPLVEQRLEKIELDVSGLDTRAQDNPVNIDFSVALNDFSTATMTGWVKPFTEKLNLDFDAKIEGFDALPVSPYVERGLQYKIQQGHINEVLDVAITEDQLDITSELVLEKFYMESLSKDELVKGEETQDLPVAMALNLLRDGDDRIRVEIPIDGDISDPNFSLAQVVGVVFRKALTQAVINYYTPFGLVNIASAVAGSAMKLRFDPLLYQAGIDQLSGDQQQRLKSLAELLQSRQQLTLSFCPKVTAMDAMAQLQLKSLPEGGLQLTDEQKQQLLQLGNSRGVAIKRALLQQQVTTTQVVLCQVEMDLKSMAEPEVAIQM